MAINLEHYYNRFDPAKNFEEHLFRAGYAMQSAEFCEVQTSFRDRLQQIADTMLKDGDVVRDAQIIVDPNTGETTCQAGKLYLRGAVRSIAANSLTIATSGTVYVGAYLKDQTVTEVDDPSLRDPATLVRNYNEPGAARWKVWPVWGYSGDGQSGEFYPVWTVIDGVVQPRTFDTTLDQILAAIAAYDVESTGGCYVVSGFRVVRLDDTETGDQVFSIMPGRARVNGVGITLATSRRVVRTASADLSTVTAEPHLSSGPAQQRVDLNNSPVASIASLQITKQKTVTVTHGNYSGAIDDLPDETVLTIESCTQGATTYVQNTDYRLTSGNVDWSLAGAEPAPGSTYTCVYTYVATVSPELPDATGCSVTGALAGTLILVNYEWKLPRWDLLFLKSDGTIGWLSGVPHETQPQRPLAPETVLPLCSVYQTWAQSTTRVLSDGVRMTSMQDLDEIKSQLGDLYDLVAIERLRTDAVVSEPAAKHGVFVDPFNDDDMRDLGLAQTAEIFNNTLTLPVTGSLDGASLMTYDPISLAPTQAIILSQTYRTGSREINPYDAFGPVPATITLNPSEDHYIKVEEITQVSQNRWGRLFNLLFWLWRPSNPEVEVLSETELPNARTRAISVDFTLGGFDQGEEISELLFDGIDIISSLTAGAANAQGVITGAFTTPADIPIGAKLVEFNGSEGNRGTAVFTASASLRTIRRTVRRSLPVDPQAQTIIMSSDATVNGLDVWITDKGSRDIVAQIRTTTVGFPTREILAEGRLKASELVEGAWNRFAFPPTFLREGEEYALVIITDDATASTAIAELGKWDASAGRWITQQPNVGVFLTSANASTWTPHQTLDLAFRVVGTSFATTTLDVDLGVVEVADATDFVVAATQSIPAAGCSIVFELTMPDATVHLVEAGQPLSLSTPQTGDVGLVAKLRGTSTATPILSGAQLFWGETATTGTYITRVIAAANPSTVTVRFDALTPGSSSVTVDCQSSAGGAWTSVPFVSGEQLGDDWESLLYRKTSWGSTDVRVRITLNGSPTARPVLRNLRVIVT